jgi:hypothetical protein
VRRLVFFSILASLVVLTESATAAGPDAKQACVASSEKAQRFRLDGKLGDAQRELLICSRDVCPSVVRSDCNVWLNEVAALMPSIVVGAKDEGGGDIVDVRVFVDGQKLQSRLDGKSVAVPTGEHTIRLERDGASPLEQKVLIREGEKARAISFQWKGSGGSTGASGSAGSTGGDTPPGQVTNREHTLWPWLVVGVGGATAVTGGVVYFVNRGDVPGECSFDSRSCARGSSVGVQRAAEVATARANAGLVVGVVGLVIVAGGLVWHFVEPTGPQTSSMLGAPPSTSSASVRSASRITIDTLTSVSPVSSPTFTGATFSGSF